jgi:hypothetical protein
MRRLLTSAVFGLMISPALADTPPNPPPIPPQVPPPHQASDQVKCQRDLLTWVVSYLDDPDNTANRKNFVSKTLAIANCANSEALQVPVAEAMPLPPRPPATQPAEAPKKE